MRVAVSVFVLFLSAFAFCSPIRSSLGAERNNLSPSLPYDTEIEFLESNGNQWIDTGISVVNNLISTDIEFQATATYNDKWVFGMYNNIAKNSCNYLIGSYNGWCIGLYDGWFYRPNLDTDTDRHRVLINIDSRTLFDDVVLISKDSEKSYSLTYNFNAYLFASHRDGVSTSQYSLPARIFYCRMWVDGNLVRDFIPVIFTNELGETEGGMYDRVTNQIFRNQGTGSFILGPEV